MTDILPAKHVRPLPQAHAVPTAENSHSLLSEVEIREYWRVVYKYRVIILASTLLVGLVMLIYAFTVTPIYTSTSKLRISTYEPILTQTKIEDLLQQKSKETGYLETQIQEITSYSLADRVMQDPKIRALFSDEDKASHVRKLFSAMHRAEDKVDTISGYKTPIRILSNYIDAIKVTPVRRTSLVTVQASSESALAAAMIANKHAQTYIDWVRDSRIQQQTAGLTYLRAQADELREKVVDLEREMAEYAEANSIVAVNKDENVTVQKMSQLNRLLTDTTARRIEAENIYKEAVSALDKDSAGSDDASLQNMRSELVKLEAERGQLASKFTSSYPRMLQLDAQIKNLRASIAIQRQQIVNGLKAKASALEQEERSLKEEVEQQTSRAFELSKKEVQYNVLGRELASSRELLQSVLRQIKETAFTVEGNASNVSIVDYATTPIVPSFPRKKLMLFIGLLSGAALGIGLAFLINYLDNTIRTPEDLVNVLKLPNLGVVPSFEEEQGLPKLLSNIIAMEKDPELVASQSKANPPVSTPPTVTSMANSEQLPIVYLSNPKSLASEAYRTIRTGILLSQAGEPPRRLLITSAQSAEGKTTSSINLAASLASAGGRVVLIDADLRRPSVYKYFNFDPQLPGLVDVLTGQRTLEEVYILDRVKRITLLPGGCIPPNPAELLGSIEMANLIEVLARQFDYVVIDSPPILPVTDSVVLSRHVDGVVLVIKGASTPKKVIKDAKERLQAVGARVLGTILNDVNVNSGDYYYYNRYYYSYYNRPESSEKQAIG